MDLRDIDLNLLLVLHQLLQRRSVSASAEQLGVTQPAVSNALKRLRALLGDELFLRTSHGMQPTPYALQLAEPVGQALQGLQAALSRRDQFDPSCSQRRFHIAMSDIGEMYFLPPLMQALAQRAPGVSIGTLRPHAGDLQGDMEAGRVDLALGLLPQLGNAFYQRRLFRQHYVCAFRKGHPQVRAPISLEQFCALGHVGVQAAQTGHAEVDALLERAGIRRRMALVVPDFIAVGHILQSTDLIATLPQRFAERCAGPFGLSISPHPARLPEIAINLFWHARFHRDAAGVWLRQLFAELFADASQAAESVAD